MKHALTHGGTIRRPEDKVLAVTRYAATDGTTFNTESEALEYQYELDFKEWCLGELPVDSNTARLAVACAVLAHWHVREKP
jgi:hypothetical protein